ncbi:hypothetical protein BDW66DRAFT_12242 [Aspergillus desertorum]
MRVSRVRLMRRERGEGDGGGKRRRREEKRREQQRGGMSRADGKMKRTISKKDGWQAEEAKAGRALIGSVYTSCTQSALDPTKQTGYNSDRVQDSATSGEFLSSGELRG